MSTRKRAPCLFVIHNGERISLYELSKRTGIDYAALRRRHAEGDEGERLVRPSKASATKQRRDDLKQKAEMKAATTKQQLEQATRDRKSAKAAHRAKIAAEHAAAFSRPLIDAKLLKPKERAEIRERVMNAGQRNWRMSGTSF